MAPGRRQCDVQRAAAKLTAEVPDETAGELLGELTGGKGSVPTAPTLPNAVAAGVGGLEVAPTREAGAAKVAQVAAGKRRRPLRVLASEGAYVPTRPERAKGSRGGRKKIRAPRARWPGEWREAQGLRFYLGAAERSGHLLSWPQIQDDEERFAALRQVKEVGLIPEDQGRRCVGAAGAQWLWARGTERFPTAREILDS